GDDFVPLIQQDGCISGKGVQNGNPSRLLGDLDGTPDHIRNLDRTVKPGSRVAARKRNRCYK
ncbi:MAG: hypothetical protein LBH09_06955, partial [Peptococcaceae bacterium]|nr:hypothetical protein [Peptococcaceae bacterium]